MRSLTNPPGGLPPLHQAPPRYHHMRSRPPGPPLPARSGGDVNGMQPSNPTGRRDARCITTRSGGPRIRKRLEIDLRFWLCTCGARAIMMTVEAHTPPLPSKAGVGQFPCLTRDNRGDHPWQGHERLKAAGIRRVSIVAGRVFDPSVMRAQLLCMDCRRCLTSCLLRELSGEELYPVGCRRHGLARAPAGRRHLVRARPARRRRIGRFPQRTLIRDRRLRTA
jgi:hypothetical protein